MTNKITISQIIQGQQEEQRAMRRRRCAMRGFHTPYPDGYFERCFDCGLALTLTLTEKDEKEAKLRWVVLGQRYMP